MLFHSKQVTTVVVTYGNRWKYLCKVICALQSLNIKHIIVVLNGPTDSSSHIKFITENTSSISALELNRNRGSAIGFSEGMNLALNDSSTRFVWLLDDDNLPTNNALHALLNVFEKNASLHQKLNIVACGYRPLRPEHAAFFSGRPIDAIASKPNSCCGFHYSEIKKLFTISQGFIRNSESSYSPNSNDDTKIVPYMTYGGTLLERSALDDAGYPNRDFVLYCDDTDFSFRLRKHGYSIVLVKNAKIEDLEPSWSEKNKARQTIFYRLVNSKDIVRAQYKVRNSIYVSKVWRRSNNFLFLLNILLFSTGLILYGIRLMKFSSTLKLLQAVYFGVTGKLGYLKNHDELLSS